MKMNEIQNKYSGYFIINENIEKMGLSEKELLTYLKIKSIEELKFKKSEYYIEKYGNEVILGPDYETKNRFNRSKWRKKLQRLSILIFRIDNLLYLMQKII